MASAATVNVRKINDFGIDDGTDFVAVEEPLELRLRQVVDGAPSERSLSVTMRTPGSDFDLASGFLFSEGIVRQFSDILSISHQKDAVSGSPDDNVVVVDLSSHVHVSLDRLERHFVTNSSCGVCSKTSIEAIQTVAGVAAIVDDVEVEANVINALPDTLRRAQKLFDQTGGLHASALLQLDGSLICVREDVGRHNALDKVIGDGYRRRALPFEKTILLLSGRVSFELIQKALMARISIVAAVGAPSSLAVDLAKRNNITLIGFLRDGRFNIYSAPERVLFGDRL